VRAEVGDNDDDDDFIVWSDDAYGDTDGDEIAELPVSRIPDARNPSLVRAALSASPRSSKVGRAGVRNVAREFADLVYRNIPGNGAGLLVSKPTVSNQRPAYSLAADHLYFMLHGSSIDGSRFWGEGTPGNAEAVGIENVPNPCGAVVFTGCCWGALPVNTTANRYVPGRPLGTRTSGQSIALTCLLRGALAFVGCTGEHYSPRAVPRLYFGGPMHAAFWNRIKAGSPPVMALWEAKREYSLGMPHGQTDAEPRAIEMKILRQYTCLGLGW
jgi:hypothetical protein